MREMTRREWHRLALGGVLGAARADSRVRGVAIGVQSYSFRDRPLDAMVDAIAAAGIGNCELWQDHAEPHIARDALREWRLRVPMEHFASIRRTFDRARIALTAYNLSFTDDFTNAEIQRGFEMAAALGVTVITASANQSTVPRVAPLAERFRTHVAVHNHSDLTPNEFATPDDFIRALAVSRWIAVNLDIGHFTAANFDAVAFLDAHHDRILSLHIKDRKRNQGPFVPFGTGDAPIVPVLKRLRDRRWQIPADIEYEYEGTDSIEEVKRCFAYCKAALES